MRVTVDFMNLCQEASREKDSILRPAEQRMQKLKVAIPIWVSKPANIISSKERMQPTEDQIKPGAHDKRSSH